MTTSKRMALAFGCMLLALAFYALMGTIPAALRYGPRYTVPILQILVVYFGFALPGWVLALPFVILFKHADGWRTGAILAIGTAIGPVFILTWALVAAGSIRWRSDGAAAIMALFIGFLTTLLYVLFLRFFTRQAPELRS